MNKSDPVELEDVSFFCEDYFGEVLSPKQVELVHAIAFKESKRIIILSLTRYGKSFSVAMAVLLYIRFNPGKKIGLIAPLQTQTSILRNYIAGFAFRSHEFVDLIQMGALGAERLKKEVSKNRITFKNGCSLQVLSAEGEATRLMGWGFDLVVVDESCLVSKEVFNQKISRMLGDNPDSMLVEIGNPWNRNNHFYQHWLDPAFLKIHVGWEEALREGRITQEFLDEQRKILTANEFKILYEANFPNESEDALLRTVWIEDALKRDFDWVGPVNKELELRSAIKEKLVAGEGEASIVPFFVAKGFNSQLVLDSVIKVKEGALEPLLPVPRIVMGVDVAEMGLDSTVVTIAKTFEGKLELLDVVWWDKKDTMVTSGKVDELANKWKPSVINVDATGVGSGVASRLQELGWNARGIKVGSSPTNERFKVRFSNLKAQYFWKMRDMFEQGLIKIVSKGKLLEQLALMRYEVGSTSKIKIIDPDKSPDFSDSLMLCCNTDSGIIIMNIQ
jgi:hypothetical protein